MDNLSDGQILTNCFGILWNLSTDTFFLFYVDSVVQNDLMARKKWAMAKKGGAFLAKNGCT